MILANVITADAILTLFRLSIYLLTVVLLYGVMQVIG